jgi:hypothetical protein
MLDIFARVLRWRANELGIPLVLLTATDLRAHRLGVTTHAEVSRAFPKETNHTDPGSDFPLVDLISAARDAMPTLIR